MPSPLSSGCILDIACVCQPTGWQTGVHVDLHSLGWSAHEQLEARQHAEALAQRLDALIATRIDPALPPVGFGFQVRIAGAVDLRSFPLGSGSGIGLILPGTADFRAEVLTEEAGLEATLLPRIPRLVAAWRAGKQVREAPPPADAPTWGASFRGPNPAYRLHVCTHAVDPWWGGREMAEKAAAWALFRFLDHPVADCLPALTRGGVGILAATPPDSNRSWMDPPDAVRAQALAGITAYTEDLWAVVGAQTR